MPFFSYSIYFSYISQQWLCGITRCSQSYPPRNFSGSILADEMGLGKTLQTIGLILSNPPKGHVYPEGINEDEPPKTAIVCKNEEGEEEEEECTIPIPSKALIGSQKIATLRLILKAAGLKQSGKKADQIERIVNGIRCGMIDGSHFPSFMMNPPSPHPSTASLPSTFGICTLIVCPVSVMSNWEYQIESFVKKGVLNVRSYHGQDRHELLPLLQGEKIDVLIVSYHTLSSEFKNTFSGLDSDKEGAPPPKKMKKSSLFDVQFHRAILDEAVSKVLQCFS